MQKRLLIVEDEPAILFALELFFSRQGFQVDTADGRAAAEAILAGPPYSVVIADLRLSGSHATEGLDVVSAAHRRSAETRILLLTAYGSPEVEHEARLRGAHVLLHKPQPLPAIAEVVSSLLGES